MNESSSGEIITFYSYKGGTGRTMALANVACLLGRDKPAAEPGQTPRVLAIDWDFEAPGLHRFFHPYLTDEAAKRFDEAPGCLELFTALDQAREDYSPRNFVANREKARQALEGMDLDAYLLPTQVPGLAFMKAGRFDAGYAGRVNEFQWDRLFRETMGLFSGFADFLRARFDYVLLDSRTGLNDSSGICTTLLPDKLVVVFTPNRQSLSGVAEVVRKAVTYRKQFPDGRPLTVFPLPSRIEMTIPALEEAWRLGRRVESSPARAMDVPGYQPLFEQLFDEVYARSGTDLKDYFVAVMLQHIPDYAYGEPIAVLLEQTASRISLAKSYAEFKERLVELRVPWDSLAEARQEAEAERQCRDATARAQAGDIESAVRIAYALLDAQALSKLPEPIWQAILAVARTAYPNARQTASALIRQAMTLTDPEREDDSLALAEFLVEAGDLCLEFGDYRLAGDLFERSRARMAAAFGDAHAATIASTNKLAEARLGLGELAGARSLAEAALEASRHLQGDENQSRALEAMGNLANVLSAQGEPGAARPLQEQVLTARRRLLGEKHPDTIAAMQDLGMTLKALGDSEQALELLSEAAELSAKRPTRKPAPLDHQPE